MKKILQLLTLALLLPSSNIIAQEYSARYRVTFTGDWTPRSHPIDYPNGAHFSPLIGNTHNLLGFIWRPGTIASDGIEQMAETGGTSILVNEIEDLSLAGNSENLVSGLGTGTTGTVIIEFVISESHPLFSMVTMIAPSPDWFLGVHGLDLRQNGVWMETLTVELLPYDSGTDSGTTYVNVNSNTSPGTPIQRITTDPLPGNVPLGSFLFERLTVQGVPFDQVFLNGFE